jgi:hypothetical protein
VSPRGLAHRFWRCGKGQISELFFPLCQIIKVTRDLLNQAQSQSALGVKGHSGGKQGARLPSPNCLNHIR